ncbi:MAG TPA: hypothetical protein PKO06_24585, partial [Candidatus Ozemobacteraceae bacterium]|nr:hypothetical protein [Candidatus Ozemobacteraceae bacterium]
MSSLFLPADHQSAASRLLRLCLAVVVVWLLYCPALEAAPPGRKVHREPMVRESTHVAGLTTESQTKPGAEAVSRASDDDTDTDEQVKVPRWMSFWREERAAAARRGWAWYLESSGEYSQTLKDPAGGHNRSYYHDAYLELSVDVKTAKLGTAGTAFLSLVGGREHVFSAAEGASPQEDEHTPTDTNPGAGGSFQLYELWYERPVGKALWLIGLRDISSDFG